MQKEGIYLDYKKFKVSKEQERKWMRDMVNTKLDELSDKGNWEAISFLNHHGMFKYLDKILESKPLGEYWEKCAFLEELYQMIRHARFSRTNKKRALNYIKEEGDLIIERTESPDRIHKLLDKI